MTGIKLQRYRDEYENNAEKISTLEARNKVLEGKIMEAENLEIRALMRSEHLTLSELTDLVHSLREKHQTPYTAYREDAGNQEDQNRMNPDVRKDDDEEDTDDEEA